MNTIFRTSFIGLCILAASGLYAEVRPNSVLEPHAKDLVVLAGDQLVPFNSDNSTRFLHAPYTILYFGAGWCPDCRHFSPALVTAYNQQQDAARQFEVLLISHDKTAEGMLKFMKTEQMRWPALSFEKVASAKDLNSFFSGHGIPCLTVIDSRGTVVLQSKNDQDANEVLLELAVLLKRQGTK
jgi:thiol-disulfide isomerase/thioredoxin